MGETSLIEALTQPSNSYSSEVEDKSIFVAFRREASSARDFESFNAKRLFMLKISDRIEFIAQRKDDWNERGSKAPNKVALERAKEILEELYDSVESNSYSSEVEDKSIFVAFRREASSARDFESFNAKRLFMLKISDRIEFIAQRKDDWNERGSKAPNKVALERAKEILEELYDSVESKQLLWLDPFISSDEDGWITIVWHGEKHTLHLNIEGNEIEYVKVWRDGVKTYLDVGDFNNVDYLTLWKWLIMNEKQFIKDEEILYRNVRGNPDFDEYRYERGKLKILDNAFLSKSDRRPSVDRAKIVENDPNRIKMCGSGIVSLLAREVRNINSVVVTWKNRKVNYDVDVIFTPSDFRPAHSEIVVDPDFVGGKNTRKAAYRHLRSALADIATARGWIIPPSQIEEA